MKKSIKIVVLVLLSLVCSCQKKEREFSKSDLTGTWYDVLTEYTLNENGRGYSSEVLGEWDLQWDVRNDSLLIDFTLGTHFKQWKYSIDSIVKGETNRGEKIRILYLSSSSDHARELKQVIEN